MLKRELVITRNSHVDRREPRGLSACSSGGTYGGISRCGVTEPLQLKDFGRI